MARELKKYQLVEQSVNKKFNKTIWRPFIEAVKQYRLIEPGDKIAVCVSGGKDSFLNAVLLRMLQRHSDFPFELVYLSMDPGYNRRNRELVEANAALLELPLTIFETEIFDITATVTESPCYLCARMRRGYLYSRAQALGCNKIALGHHLSDVIETTLLAMFYGSQLQGMLPKLHSTNFEGMSLIRPLYCVHEDAIIAWARYNELQFLQCACRFTENTASGVGASKRQEVKALIRELRKTNPQIDRNLFKAIHAVHLDTFPGYKSEGEAHSFLERYNRL